MDRKMAITTKARYRTLQAKLDLLCHMHGLEAWKIDGRSRRARWKDLVLAMCGVPPAPQKKRGRKKKGETADTKIAHRIIFHRFFVESEYVLPLKTAISRTAKDLKIETGAVRAAWDRYRTIHLPQSQAQWSNLIDTDDIPKKPQPLDIEIDEAKTKT